MADEASVGLMIWDGRSFGTLANVVRLLRQNKKVVVYTVPAKRFVTLSDEDDWEQLATKEEPDIREKVLRLAGPQSERPKENQTTHL